MLCRVLVKMRESLKLRQDDHGDDGWLVRV